METLLATGASLALGLGILKIGHISVRTAQMASTTLAEQDLRRTVSNLLNDRKECAFNLKPSRLSDKTHKHGTITSKQLIKTGGNNTGPSPVTSDDTVILEAGKSFGDGLIKIEKMALKYPEPLNIGHGAPSFYVYYSKPHLGPYKTIGGETCTDGTGATDQAGCYIVSCKMDYHCKDVDGDCLDDTERDGNPPVFKDKCAPLNCIEGSGALGVGVTSVINCGTNEFLKGIKPNGDPDCVDLSQCPDGHILKGIKSDGTPDCVDLSQCPAHHIFAGIPADETGKRCRPVPHGVSCPSFGQYPTGINEDGTMNCAVICPFGKVYKETDGGTGSCVCPEGTTWSDNYNLCKENSS